MCRPPPSRLAHLGLQFLLDLFFEVVVTQRCSGLPGRADVLKVRLVDICLEQGSVSLLAACIRPPEAFVQGVRSDESILPALGVRPVAAPAVLAGCGSHVGAHRVQFDVAHAGQQVFFVLYQRGLVAPFPDTPARSISVVDVRDVTPPDILHHAAHTLLFLRGGEDMDMVGHQDIGVDRALIAGSRFSQPIEVGPKIAVFEKDGFPAMATLNDMNRDIR